ncbi:hypothetical protein [Paenisporosarcina indica]|uniref:UPF0738 family protein n=1 Tax=Paenisporosarcina indica TaxID=650093 RepID=UPI000950011E|nr:hypothetical protein [Paenisporosarcina indica]
MRKLYIVDSGVQYGADIRFLLQDAPIKHAVKAAGKLLTDSENNAFIYIMDDSEGYTYVQFPQTVWPLLADSLGAETEPILVWGDTEISLLHFREELSMLIFNIEGNHNYGSEFSAAVEQSFKEQLAIY